MRCPTCSIDEDRVIDSRTIEGGAAIRRRRECCRCKRRYTSYERIEKTARLMVVKKDGTRVPFENQNILRGLQAACGKRPIAEEIKLKLVQAVEDSVHQEFEREVPSVEIGRRVAAQLRAIDAVAYIRYASEYYNFRNLEEFRIEIDGLVERPQPTPDQPELFGETASPRRSIES